MWSSAMTEDRGQPVASEDKKTLELCGDQRHGHRCMLQLGHEGRHECHTPTSFVTWPRAR